jgi:hypothetical protein
VTCGSFYPNKLITVVRTHFISVNYVTLLGQRMSYSTEREQLSRPCKKSWIQNGDVSCLT